MHFPDGYTLNHSIIAGFFVYQEVRCYESTLN